MKLIDLHIHTSESDGTLTPGETVEYALKKGLSAIAITDHDTADGVKPAMKLGQSLGFEVISGIEVSTDYLGHGVHILGYFIDPDSPALQRLLDWVIEDRNTRNDKIIEAMRSDGLDISGALLDQMFPKAVIGRPHFAAYLVSRGLAENVTDAFTKYLNRGKRYHRLRTYLPIEQAIDVITAAGGKAVFAHPLQYRMEEDQLLKLTRCLVDCGIKGMECLYSGYTVEQSAYLMELAKRFGLCVTGGSDFHGSRKPQIDMGSGTGSLAVPYSLLEALRDS